MTLRVAVVAKAASMDASAVATVAALADRNKEPAVVTRTEASGAVRPRAPANRADVASWSQTQRRQWAASPPLLEMGVAQTTRLTLSTASGEVAGHIQWSVSALASGAASFLAGASSFGQAITTKSESFPSVSPYSMAMPVSAVR